MLGLTFKKAYSFPRLFPRFAIDTPVLGFVLAALHGVKKRPDKTPLIPQINLTA